MALISSLQEQIRLYRQELFSYRQLYGPNYEQHLPSYNNGGSGGDDTTIGLDHMTLIQTASQSQNLNDNAQTTQLQVASNISPSDAAQRQVLRPKAAINKLR